MKTVLFLFNSIVLILNTKIKAVKICVVSQIFTAF